MNNFDPVQPENFTYKALILHNHMSDWTEADRLTAEEAVARMRLGLSATGVETVNIPIQRDIAGPIKDFDPSEYVVFNWCEGLDGAPNAYDAVPPVLESMGFIYTGADAWTLATTQNKAVTKEYLVRHGIPTPASATFTRPQVDGWDRYPALVKPANEHCSFGITRESVVDTPEQLAKRIEYVLETWKCEALVEDFIDGPEYNVSCWGNGELKVLPVASIDYSAFADYHDRLCSFDAKWDPESEAFRLTEVHCPAELEADMRVRIEQVAMRAYRVMRVRDYGRIDLRVRDGVPYVLDVNSNPDITMEGGFARSARAAGYGYGRMAARILGFAAHRMPNGPRNGHNGNGRH